MRHDGYFTKEIISVYIRYQTTSNKMLERSDSVDSNDPV